MRRLNKTMRREYLLAVGATLVALLARGALDPVLGDHFPYVTFFVAVAVTTSYAGPGASVTAVVLGALAAGWFFMPPRQALTVAGGTQQLGVALYFLVTLALVWFGQALRRAKQRADMAGDGLRQEVAERIRVEGTLREMQAALVRAQRGAQAGLWEVDLRTRRLMWSDAYYDLFGLDHDVEPSVATWLSRIHPDDRDRIEREYTRAIDAAMDQSFEFRLIRPDGRVRWLHRKGQVVRDEQGTPIRVSGISVDITERKQAEEALRHSEARYRTLFDSIEEGFCIIEMLFDEQDRPVDYRFLETSPSFEKQTGLVGALGRRVRELLPALEEHWFELYGKVALTGDPVRFENHAAALNRWYEVYAFRYGQAEHRQVAVAFNDITERKQAEQALRQSEALYRAIGESIDYGVWVCAPDGRNTYASDSFLRLLGITQEQCSNFGWGDRLHPDDAWKTMAAWEECVRSGGVWDMEHRFRGADGQWHDILARGVPVKDEQGRVLSWAGINLDISRLKRSEAELRESEDRFRTLADNMSQLAWMADATGWIFWYNRRWYEYSGTTFEAMQGWGWETIHHPDHLARVIETWKRAHRTGEAWEDTFPLRGTDGAYRWFLSRAMPIHDAAGQIVRWFGTNTDITELRAAQASLLDSEERLRSLAGRLEQSVEERTEELVQSQAELRALARELNLTEQRERKRLAVELHDHLAQMLVLSKLKLSQMKNAPVLAPGCLGLVNETDDVLTQCLGYTRTLVADLAPPVLHDFGLPAALKWLGEQMLQHDLRVAVHLGPDELHLPEEQAVLLFQSVRELLMNVVKHAGAGEAIVTLDPWDEELRIQVRDDGIGFDPSADGPPVNAMSSKFGLFSIRERMRAMGGALEVESERGKGTTATLRVPLKAPGADQEARDRHDHVMTRSRSAWPVAQVSHPLDTVSGEASAVSAPRDTLPIPPALGGASIRVLLVDDHAMVRQGLRSVLESYPDLVVVGEAWDGQEAVAGVERLRPDIVVMDINMPKMNGIEATVVIKARYPATIIVGLSVNAEGENQRAMLEAGAAILLTKEAAVEELHAAILKVLDRK